MNFKTHVIGGISAGVLANEAFIHYANPSGDTASQMLLGTMFVAGSVIGSILPDIDHRGSFIGRRMRIISTPLTVAGKVTKGAKKLSNTVTGRKGSTDTIISHRGITHTPLLLMAIVSALLFLSHNLVSGFASLLFSYMSIGLGVGIASHILLDCLTKGGVPLLYPFSGKKFSFLPLKTGGFLEGIVGLVMIVATLLFVSGRHFLTLPF
jgi:inner membrane protein